MCKQSLESAGLAPPALQPERALMSQTFSSLAQRVETGASHVRFSLNPSLYKL